MKRRGLGAVSVGAVLALTFTFAGAFADERDDWVSKQNAADNQRAELEEQISGLDEDLQQMYLKLDDVRRNIPEAQGELDVAQSQYASAQRELEQITDRLNVAIEEKDRIDAEIEESDSESKSTRHDIGQLVREVYRSGDLSSSPLVIAMTSKSTADITQRAAGAQTIAVAQSRALTSAQESLAVERNRYARQEALTERVSNLQAKASEARDIAAEAKSLATEKLGELQKLEQTEIARAADVEKVKVKAKEQLAASEAAYQTARANIARIDEQNRQNQIAWQQNQSQKPGKPGANSSGGVQTNGLFGYPFSQTYPITSTFGYRFHPIYQQMRLHAGTDYGAPCGTPVLATANGVVSSASFHSSMGNYVMLNYGLVNGNSFQTIYMHLTRSVVSTGQSVSKGQLLGYVGTTGSSTGCHLHYEMHRNGTPVDARNYM